MPEQKSKRLIAAEQKAARIAAEEKAKAEMRDALDAVKAAIDDFLADECADISNVRAACQKYESATVAYVYTKAGRQQD